MKIFLTRHGETVGNKKKILEGGRLHGRLSNLGFEQAKKLAIRLKDEKFNYIYSSDLKRAKDTVKEIAKFHPNVAIKFTKDLREIDLGDFTGKYFDEVDWNNQPKNLETRKKLQRRAMKFINKLCKQHKNQSILIIAHANFNKALITGILGKGVSAMDEIDQKNTCVNIIEIKEDKNHIIHLLNCVKHLG
jgi:broad specificity phosphatase PhoE